MKCPRCARELEVSGSVVDPADGAEYPVYQCDHCTVSTEILGYPCEASLTFLVREGVPLDSQTFSPLALNAYAGFTEDR